MCTDAPLALVLARLKWLVIRIWTIVGCRRRWRWCVVSGGSFTSPSLNRRPRVIGRFVPITRIRRGLHLAEVLVVTSYVASTYKGARVSIVIVIVAMHTGRSLRVTPQIDRSQLARMACEDRVKNV